MSDYIDDVKRFTATPNEKAVDTIVKYCGIALRSSKDAALVSSSDKKELNRVRDGFAKKKLGLSEADAESAIAAVCERLKGERQKHRVTFYYLVAEESDTLGKLG